MRSLLSASKRLPRWKPPSLFTWVSAETSYSASCSHSCPPALLQWVTLHATHAASLIWSGHSSAQNPVWLLAPLRVKDEASTMAFTPIAPRPLPPPWPYFFDCPLHTTHSTFCLLGLFTVLYIGYSNSTVATATITPQLISAGSISPGFCSCVTFQMWLALIAHWP